MGLGEVSGNRSAAGGWGVLGGTFDPIHYAHLAIAEQVRDTLALRGIIFIPAGAPPHKGDRTVTAPSHRMAMVERAIADNPTFEASRIELERPGMSYTVDTLETLVPERDPLTFIMSAEALPGFVSWRRPERIVELSEIAVVPRRGYRRPNRSWLAEHFPGREARFHLLDGPDLGHSASAIRALAAAGRSVRYLVPPVVEAYIREQRLYAPELWRKN